MERLAPRLTYEMIITLKDHGYQYSYTEVDMFLLFEMMSHLSNGGIGNSWSLTFPTLGLPHPVLCSSVLYTNRLKRLKIS